MRIFKKKKEIELKILPERMDEYLKMESMLMAAEKMEDSNPEKAKNILRQLTVYINSYVNI